MAAAIDHVVTSGTFTLDDASVDVDNNVWVVGDDSEVFVIDAAHDTDAIIAAVGDLAGGHTSASGTVPARRSAMRELAWHSSDELVGDPEGQSGDDPGTG